MTQATVLGRHNPKISGVRGDKKHLQQNWFEGCEYIE